MQPPLAPSQPPEALVSRCQRWREGRARYRPAGELFEPSRSRVELIDEKTAKAFVVTHHYSHSYPAARLRIGVFHKPPFGAERLAGVAVFSVPVQPAAATKYLGVASAQGVELGRFVLLDELAANAETWTLARAFRLLRERLPELRGVISYADPVARYDADGKIVKPGHTGTIYRAHNAKYHGRSGARTLTISSSGLVLNERSISKIRAGERGIDYACRQLVAMGAPARVAYESGRDYLKRALAEGGFRRVRHPGNHVFSWQFQ